MMSIDNISEVVLIYLIREHVPTHTHTYIPRGRRLFPPKRKNFLLTLHTSAISTQTIYRVYEKSKRALDLTSEIIRHNPAHYTVWLV